MYLKPISNSDFIEAINRHETVDKAALLAYFQDTIEQSKKFSIAPSYWFIPETKNLTVVCTSENIHQLSPYSAAEWESQGAFFWMSNMHPEDQQFVMAAIAMAVQLNETPPIEQSMHLQSSIYCRMKDANNNYRWVVIQFPQRLYNDEGKIISVLVLTTDLSHLPINFSKMMTVLDANNKKNHYFLAHVEEQKLIKLNTPNLSKREHEVIKEMAKGLNTPQIAEKLFISYHTVENHKRNLRAKTNTKTSAELMNFVWANGLI